MDILSEGKKVFDIEIKALEKTRDALDDVFVAILNHIINCKGKVVFTGMGKPGHIAKKLAATFSSLGTESFFLHPGEAMHGDLGMLDKKDTVIAISYSGESDEIINILPNIKLVGSKLIAITGNKASTLAKSSDIVQVLPSFDEACHLGLAPTSSTTAVLCYGDALAVTASKVYGFSDVDFGKYHPAGSLGKKLVIKVDDLMTTGDKNAIVGETATLRDAILELSEKGLGLVSVVNTNNELIGVITDGDLRRQLSNGVNVYELNVSDIMSKNPIRFNKGRLAIEALEVLKERNVSCMPILDGNIVVGTIRIQDIINIGIVG